MDQYPRREAFFAYRFCRLLTKCCAAQDIGSDVCWMLAVIAHQEDAKRYSGPVTYYNEQLMPLCNFGSHAKLIRCRDRAVAAGWLHYEGGGKGRAGRYWVLVPPQYGAISDSPIDEDDLKCASKMEAQNGCASKIEAQVEAQRAAQVEAQPERNGKRKCQPSYPIPDPSPDSLSSGDDEKKPPPMEPKEFLERWNKFADSKGLRTCRKLTEDRRAKLRIRLHQEGWLDEFRAAIKKLPLPGDGWQPDLDYLIRNEKNADDIAGGKFDWRESNGKSDKPKLQTYSAPDPKAGMIWMQ